MIILSTIEVQRFIAASSGINDTKMLPIYGYVKLICNKEQSCLVKHNGHKFIVFDIDADFKKEQTLMIETKPLFGFVKFSRTKEIKITPNGNNVTITDGERSISCQLTKDVYPTIPDNSKSEKFEISKSVLTSLSVAKQHVLQSSEKLLREWRCFVHIRKIEEKYYIIGTRGEVTYFKGFKEVLPEISLETETISSISGYEQLTYSSVDNFHYFETIGSMYGFVKPETRCSDSVEMVLKNFKSPNSFETSTQPIIDFCEMIALVNDTSVPPDIMFEQVSNEALKISFVDMADNIKAEEEIPVQNKTFDLKECFFLPKNILTVLKGAKKDKVKISYAHRNFIVTSDEEDYIGAIMELAKIA